MCFHPDRCDILSVTKSKRKRYHALHGQMLSQQYSLLGCHTDLRHDLGDTSASPTKQAGPWVLGRTLKIGSFLVKGRAFKAVVTPVLEYASSIWHPNNINLINRLESVQQKAAWWIPEMLQDMRCQHADNTRLTISPT